ncbi:MAG: 1-deoxy-D-xylulose-5-phosphate synthase [Chlamydiae bacterium]|nr:MAG: 1-deoxy-D-xylulose-5-phosphate synthase [Chlamydiota bacterium]
MKKIFLDNITLPEQLRQLNEKNLPTVCNELRQFIIDHVAQTGGHFASNLGSVELTVALHYVFNTPEDEIVWDTGHQAYPHKILTGRKGKFDTIRKYKGLSGFPSPEESPYDTYYVGHAGTSISVALGLAKARDLKNKNNHITAVIGDGALTSGLAFEGLNNSHNAKRFIVILNDNEVSISKTMGAFAKHFSKIVANPKFRNFKQKTGRVIAKIPIVGNAITRIILRLQGGIKHILAPQNVFENLGFHYIGPIDGHNVKELVEILRMCKTETEMPVLLHVMTKKGYGFKPAESDPESYHGVTPFDKTVGLSNGEKSAPTYTETFSEIICNAADENKKIVVISAAMCSGTGMTKFAKENPKRFVDVGIAEQHAVTFAGGLAARGMIPVVTIYSTFLQRAYDEIEHDVCLPNLPVIFAVDRAGLVGGDGKTHHGVFDISYLRHLPNMKIFMPRDKIAMEKVLAFAIENKSPCAIRYPRGEVLQSTCNLPDFAEEKITSWEILKSGDDIILIAIGQMVSRAFKTAEILEKNGINATVIDACAIQPLDEKTLLFVAEKCKKIVTLEDHILAGGFGAAIVEKLSDENINCKIVRIGIEGKFIEHGSINELYSELGWQPERLAEKIIEEMKITKS